MEEKTTAMFETMSVPKAVLSLVIPSMVGTLMSMLYNMADTLFIGLSHNDYQLAAVSIAMPVFMLLMAFGSVFGIGGASVISRSLGEGRLDHASRVSATCMWGSIFIGLLTTLLCLLGMEPILKLSGVTENTHDLAKSYLTIVALGGPFAMVATCQSSVIRAQGESGRGVAGMLIGNAVNIVLDPVMILGFGWGVRGAAWATFVGNVCAALYYLLYYLRGKSVLSIRLKDFTVKEKVLSSVLAIGLPSALSMVLMSISQILANTHMVVYGDLAVAALGVGSKVVMVSTTLCMGIGLGAQPLLGYSVGARNWERFKSALRFTCLFAFLTGAGMTLLCYAFLPKIVGLFLTEPEAYQYGVDFSRIMMTTGFLSGIFNVFAGCLQSMGAAAAALVVNISRQGIVYIPMLLLLSRLYGMVGIVIAQPVTDALSLVLAVVCFLFAFKKIRNTEPKPGVMPMPM